MSFPVLMRATEAKAASPEDLAAMDVQPGRPRAGHWARHWATAATVGILILVIQHFAISFQPASFDAVQHFMLVDEIMKHGMVRPAPVSTIGAMAIYPPAAHWLAAIIGWIGGSGFVGMMIVVDCAVFLSYLLVARLAGIEMPVRLLLLVLGFKLLTRTMALFGWEIVGNFFYPQLVGDVPYLAILFWAAHGRKDVETGIGFLILGSLALWLQPLTAVHIFGTGAVFLTFLVAERLVAERAVRRSRLRPMAIAGVVVYVACAAAVTDFHPYFRAMRVISNGDGGLTVGIKHINAAAFAALALGVVNLLRALRASRTSAGTRERTDAVVGSALVAAALLMIGQILAFDLADAGSPYAIKKHLFFVITLSLINAVRLIAAPIPAGLNRFRLPAPLLAPFVAGLATLIVLHSYTTPVVPVLTAMSYAASAVRTGFPGFEPGNTYAQLNSLSRNANAMITGAAFGRPKVDDGKVWWYVWQQIPDYMKYAMIDRGQLTDRTCTEVAGNFEFEIVPRDCLSNYTLGTEIDFRPGGNSSFFKRDGWTEAEPGGEWALGPVGGVLQLNLGSGIKGPFELKIRGSAFFAGSHPRQDITVEVNGRDIATWPFDGTHPPGIRTARIPADLVKDGSLNIRFKAPGAVSPARANVGSSDDRVLGISVVSMTLTAAD